MLSRQSILPVARPAAQVTGPKVIADAFHQGLAMQAVAKISEGDWSGVRLDFPTSSLDMVITLGLEGVPKSRALLQAALEGHQLSLTEPQVGDAAVALSSPNDLLIRAPLESAIGRAAFDLVETRGQRLAEQAFTQLTEDRWSTGFSHIEGSRDRRVNVKLGSETERPRGVQEIVAMNAALAVNDLRVVHTHSSETRPSVWMTFRDGSVDLEPQSRFGVGAKIIKDSIRDRGQALATQALKAIGDLGGFPKGEKMLGISVAPGWRGTADLDVMRAALRKSGFDLVDGGDDESHARSGPYLSTSADQLMIKPYARWF